MEKTNWALWILVSVLALLVGGFIGATTLSTHTVETKTVIQNSTCPTSEPVVLTNTVVVDKFADFTANATSDYKDALNDDDSNLVCDGSMYDFNQVSYVSQKNVVIGVDNTDKKDTKTTVYFDEKIKFSDKDVSEKCYRTDEVSVVYHSDTDKDTQVFINGI